MDEPIIDTVSGIEQPTEKTEETTKSENPKKRPQSKAQLERLEKARKVTLEKQKNEKNELKLLREIVKAQGKLEKDNETKQSRSMSEYNTVEPAKRRLPFDTRGGQYTRRIQPSLFFK